MKEPISQDHRNIIQSSTLTALKTSLSRKTEDDYWDKKEIAELSKKAMKLANEAAKTDNIYEVKNLFKEIKNTIDALANPEEKIINKSLGRMKVLFHRIHPTPEKTLAHIDYLVQKAESKFDHHVDKLRKLANDLDCFIRFTKEPPLFLAMRIKSLKKTQAPAKKLKTAQALADKILLLAPPPTKEEKQVVIDILTKVGLFTELYKDSDTIIELAFDFLEK